METINYSVLNVCMDKVDEITSSYDHIEEKWASTEYLNFYNKPAVVNSFVMKKDNFSGTKYFLSYIVVDLNDIVHDSLINSIQHLPEKQKSTLKRILYEWNVVDKHTVRKNLPTLFCACVVKEEPKGGYKNKEFSKWVINKLNVKLLKLMNQIDEKIVCIFDNNIGPLRVEWFDRQDIESKIKYREKEISKIGTEIGKYLRSVEANKAYDDFYTNKFGEHPEDVEEVEEIEEIDDIKDDIEDDIFDFDTEIKTNVYR